MPYTNAESLSLTDHTSILSAQGTLWGGDLIIDSPGIRIVSNDSPSPYGYGIYPGASVRGNGANQILDISVLAGAARWGSQGNIDLDGGPDLLQVYIGEGNESALFGSTTNLGSGDDTAVIYGHISSSTIDAGEGRDLLSIKGAYKSFYGTTVKLGAGNDEIYSRSRWEAWGLKNFESSVFTGGEGNDVFDILLGSGSIDGGLGADTYRLDTLGAHITGQDTRTDQAWSVFTLSDGNTVELRRESVAGNWTIKHKGDILTLVSIEKVIIDSVELHANSAVPQVSSPVVRGNSLYTIVDGPSWTQAEANSLKLGGHLASIQSDAENALIYSLLNNSRRETSNYWIGLYLDSLDWAWSDGLPMNYSNWRWNEPNGDGVYAHIRHYDQGSWNDITSPLGNYDSGLDFYDTRKGIAEIPFIRRGDSAYVIVQGPTWEEAEANAVALGGHLVTINDAEENEWLLENIIGDTGKNGFWTGLNDTANEGNWVWSSGEASAYRNWMPPGPNNASGWDGGDEDAVVLVYDGTYWDINIDHTGLWNDADTADGRIEHQLRGIAEIKLAPNNTPTGTPTISGDLKVGSTLTIDASAVQDADNFTGYTPDFKYTWESSADGTTWTKLTTTDATDNNTTYTLTTAEVGKQIRGVVSYVDGYGTNEALVSKASEVALINDSVRHHSYIVENPNVHLLIESQESLAENGNTLAYPVALEWDGNGPRDWRLRIFNKQTSTVIDAVIPDIRPTAIEILPSLIILGGAGHYGRGEGIAVFDLDGEMLWSSKQAGLSYNLPFIITEANSLYTIRSTQRNSYDYIDPRLARLDISTGAVFKEVPFDWIESPQLVGATKDDGVVIAQYNGARRITKYAQDLTISWTQSFESLGFIDWQVPSIVETFDGNFLAILTGYTGAYDKTLTSLVTLDKNGVVISVHNFENANKDDSNRYRILLPDGEKTAYIVGEQHVYRFDTVSSALGMADIITTGSHRINPDLLLEGGQWSTYGMGDKIEGYGSMLTVTSSLVRGNKSVTGTPALSGTTKVGQVITIDKTPIEDADNFTGYTPDFKYSWESSTDGMAWTALTTPDATDQNNTYTLTSSEVGKQIRGVVSYVDGYGKTEALNSSASIRVEAQVKQPVIRGESLYTFVDPLTWSDAENKANALGGHLITINSEEENEFAKSIAEVGFYIGYNRNSGSWSWSSGESEAFTKWRTQPEGGWAEPNNWRGIETVAMMMIGDQFSGYWNDIPDDGRDVYGAFGGKGLVEIPFIRRGDSAYVIVQGPTWEEAEANAVKLGGHLVTINDAEENEWISQYLPNENLWIGITDSKSEGTWQWVDGSTSTYRNWQSGEPSGGAENWGLIYSNTRTWNDGFNKDHGSWLQRGIAEIKLAPNNTPTGTPTLTGNFKEGQVITIDKTPIQDADNFTSYTPDFKYTWEVSRNGTTWTPLINPDATDENNTYTLTTAEGNSQIRGVVSYVDGYGMNESVTTPSASVPTSIAAQQISGLREIVTYRPGSEISIPLLYLTTDGESGLSGLTLNVHHDSTRLKPLGQGSGITDQIAANAIMTSILIDDTGNLDSSLDSDKIIQLNWASLDNTFPGTDLPAHIATANFTTSSDAYDPITGAPLNTVINFTASETASNYGFEGTPVTLIPESFHLDIDGDGRTTALGDGLMVIRKLFGAAFAGDALTNKAASSNAAVDTQAMHHWLEAGIASGKLDVDRDGRTTALGDGLMVIRHMFGTAFAGDALIDKAMSNSSPYAGQSNAAELVSQNIEALINGA